MPPSDEPALPSDLPARDAAVTGRQGLVEQMLDAVLAAQRQGTLGELLRQRPRAARWLMRRFSGPVRGSAGDAFDGAPADVLVATLLLRWGVAQLRPDGLDIEAPIPPQAWLQLPGWRPMLAVSCHVGFNKVPDFPARYRRRPEEPALDNLCGLWDVAPSSFYRYLDRARHALAALVVEGLAGVGRRLSLRQAAADEAMRLLAVADPAACAAWHLRQAPRAIERRDPAAALWHAWRGGRPATFIALLLRHAPALAGDPATDALVERLAAEALDPRARFELWLARAALARTRSAPEREQLALERALHVAQGTGDRRLLGIACGALGKFHEPRDADRAFACYQDSAEFLRGGAVAADDALAIEHYLTTLARLAWLYVLRNDPRGRGVLEQAEALRAMVIVPDAVLGMLEQTWGELLRRSGETRQSLEHRQRALNIFERIDDRRSLLATHLNLIVTYAELHDFDRAIAHADYILAAHVVQAVEPEVLVSTHLNLGLTCFMQGRLDAAVEAYERALDQATRSDLRLHAFRARYNLAEAFYTRFKQSQDPLDERRGDLHCQAALAAPASDSNPAAMEAARQLKAEVLGDGTAPETDRLLPEETAVHVEDFAEIRRQRGRLLAQPASPAEQVQAQLAVARAYLAIALRERELARSLALRHGLADRHAEDFGALNRIYARELTREQALAAAWQAPAGDLLDEPRRLALAALLLGEGAVGKRAYAEACGVSPATASKHLGLLTERGLLVQSGKGPSTRYRLSDPTGSPEP